MYSALLTFAPIAVRAEVITLNCSGSDFTVDTSAGTMTTRLNGDSVKLTNVVINDDVFIGTDEKAADGDYRLTFSIDRKIGTLAFVAQCNPGTGCTSVVTPQPVPCIKILKNAF